MSREDNNRSKSPLGGPNKKGGKSKEISDEDMIDHMEQQMRASYQTYMEYAQRCQVELKSQSHLGVHIGTKKTKYFYFPPKIPLLEEPEKQRTYRKKFISEVSQGPEPEPLILMGDVLQQRLQEIIGDRSNPSTVRKDLSAFFKRRLAQLNIKKNKMISRWAFHSRMSVPDIEKNGILLEQALGKLQQEIDLTINRVDRLSQDDYFGNSNQKRPIPSTKDDEDPSKLKPLYEEKEEPVACSSIRDDDIEVYLRVQTYRNKLYRTFDKFITELTWLPFFQRFEIYEDSRIFIQDYKHETYDYLDGLKLTVSNSIRKKLEQNGVIEERIVYAIVEKFIKNIKGPDGGSSKNLPRLEYLMNSHKANHERPPILIGTIIEMKIHLQKIAKTFIGITIDDQTLELDNGYMFSYRISSMFPTHFQQQTLQLQFDVYDTSKENDYITLERVQNNLDQMEKQDRIRAVNEMQKQTARESKKSMVGRINKFEEVKAADKKFNHNLEKNARENHVEENFFNMNTTSTKIKRADWLEFVCFEGTVSEVIKRQSFHFNLTDQYDSLLESAFNFLDVNDQTAVNRILEDSASTHVQRAQQRQLTKFEQIKKISEDDELEHYLNIALQKTGQAKLNEMNKEQARLLKEQVKGAEQPLQLADPIPTHLIKSYYSIRLLKSREAKIKLLHVLNCFRSLQKRIALDLKENFSRNKKQITPNDCELIAPQFEKNEILNKLRFQDESLGGPGNILLTGVQRPVDSQIDDIYDLKTLKYNKQFNPRVSSTCPCVPRYHATFQRPRLYEQYSDQMDRGEIFPSSLIRRYEGKQDKWDIDQDHNDVTVTDDYGVKIIYQEALNDMLEIEEELIKVGTYYINQAESRADLDIKEPASSIDRGDVAYHLIDKEAEFQFQKLLIITSYMESYEHTNDPLEMLRLAQLIADIMVLRPRHNVEGGYFIDAYRSEIEVLKQKRELLTELISYQEEIERQANDELRLYTELKFRKINDFLNSGFSYTENLFRIQVPGVHEEENQKRLKQMNSALNQGENEEAKEMTLEQMIDQNKQAEEVKKKRIMEIAARHQSEFIDNQYADFEELLGMEEIEKTQQAKKEPAQLDPSSVDQLRESAFFNKQMDGNPWILERDPLNQYNLFGESSQRVGIFDFLESISTLSRIEAAIQQSFSELISVHMPENGLAVSSLERAMLIQARGRLKLVRNNEPLLTQSKNVIENDLFLGNSDKLMFLMKEFKAHLSPQLIKSKANPFLVSKLDIKNVSKFNFPRVKQKELISDKEQLTPDQILARMIALAKLAVTGSSFDPLLGGESKEKKSDPLMDMLFNSEKDSDEKQVKSPSLMVMSCNLIEAMRLREEIIQKIYETDILSVIYKKQLTMAGKGSTKLMLFDQINFDTSKIMGDSMNLVDYNDGSMLDLDLPFREFDNSLKSILDFNSESCIKALMTELGVEEMRAILHYQTMQMQLLQIGVSINQVMFDGAQKALSEIEFLARKKPFTVPNPILNLHIIISKTTEGHMGDYLVKEKSKYRSLISREAGDICFLIDGKKNRLRHAFSQKFSLSVARLSSNLSVDIKLRLLRSQRIRFLHCYCREVLKEAYQDSMKVQLLTSANQLRQLSMLFPNENNHFSYGVGAIQENFSFVFFQDHPEKFDRETMRVNQISQHYLDQVLDGEQILFIPSSEEIMKLEPLNRPASMDVGIAGGDTVNEQGVDQQVKELVTFSDTSNEPYYKIDEGLIRPYRKVSIANAQPHTSQSFRLLNFLSLLTRNVKLLYLMYRNSSSGMEILDLESHVLNGRPYWGEKHEILLSVKKEMTASEMESGQNQISEKIIKEIVSRRKARQNLAEDMAGLGEQIRVMNQWLNKARTTSSELLNGKFNRLIELLNIQNSILHKKFIVGVDSILDTYLDQENDECLEKSLILRDQITRKLPGLLRYQENGFNMNQVTLQAMTIKLGSRSLTDDLEHEKISQPFVNEHNLMPIELELIKSMFSKFTYYESSCSFALIKPFMRDYAYLENSFLNFKDSERQYAFTNFTGIDLKVRQFLKYRGLSSKDNSIKELMLAELEFLQTECDARHIQSVLLCWLSKGDIPRNSKELRKLLKKYKDETLLKVIEERDKITIKEKEKQVKKTTAAKGDDEDPGIVVTDAPIRMTGSQLPPGQIIDRESMNDVLGLNEERIQDQHFVTNVCEKKAEITVGKRYLEVKMMNYANSMFQSEHSSLLALFEQATTEKEIAAYIHPDQQFAGSLSLRANNNDKIKDPYKGLDACHKLASVQQFLTRLRNRCSEVETLTSGTGVVFSLRDFNECVQLMCRSLVKYGEEELRQRTDMTAIMTMQYRHLLYLQQRQTEYYRGKCDNFLREMDKLVGAKLSQRGNQIIYELDLASRELRTVKDNVYIMERRMRQELRHEYERSIVERENESRKYKESFVNYKSDLNNQIIEEVATRISETQQEIKNMVMKKKHEPIQPKKNARLSLANDTQGQNLNINIMKDDSDPSTLMTPTEIQNEKHGNYYDQEAVREINSLSRFFRRYKMFQRFKELVQREKYERDLQIQKEKLTSNQCLWEQLGEAEKRENIIRQELYFAQQNLSTYEKIIGKLQHQLETLQNEKLRLLQFKATKSKQIEAMESKIRDVEILENIDLQKVIDELQSREKKLKQLQAENVVVNERIQKEQIFNERRVLEIKKKLEQERDMKVHAFDQLEAMRLEIKAIEGKDMSNGDIWKQKCKELFDICKDLQKENDDLKSGAGIVGSHISSAAFVPTAQNIDTQVIEDAQQFYSMAPIQSATQQNTIHQRDNSLKRTDFNTLRTTQDPNTKPSTAGPGQRPQQRQLNRGGSNHPGTAPGGPRQHIQHPWSGHPSQGTHPINHTDLGVSATLTSGLSLPEIMMAGPNAHNSSLPIDHSEGGNQSSSPLSSTILNQKSVIPPGYTQLKSREHVMKPISNQNPQIMNSNELFQMHRHHMNQASGTSSDQLLASNKRKQQGRSSIRSGAQGVTIASGYQTVSAGLRLADMSDEGSVAQLPQTQLMVLGGEFKNSGAQVARSTAGITFGSNETAFKAYTRITSGNNQQQNFAGSGANLIGSKNQQQNKRLMTSKGPRRGNVGIVPDPSTTGTLYSSNLQNTRELGGTGLVMMGGPPSIRKSLAGAQAPSSNTSRGGLIIQGQNHAMMAATSGNMNLAAGMAIANNSLPTGPAQIIQQQQQQKASATQFQPQQPINFNINFNTTNYNLK